MKSRVVSLFAVLVAAVEITAVSGARADQPSGQQQAPGVRPPYEGTMLAGFHITLARTSQGVSLKCDQGCAWKTLEFSKKAKPTAINEFGMADDQTGNREKRGAFLIRIGTEDGRFALSCDRGCAWQTLGFSLSDKPTGINEYGMARPDKKWE